MYGARITVVNNGSLAEEIGLESGDILQSVNGKGIKDLIEFQFEWADEDVDIEVKKKNGEYESISIEKDYDEPLGVEFESAVFDGIRRCQNKCLFCFVDQMPPNMRQSLYVKDDDYRLSFLQGGYITLTNVKKEDIDRIKREHLSPLYVSVHATNGEVREMLLQNKKANRCLNYLKELSQAGIEFHTQVVLCPGFNDGEILEETYQDLKSIKGIKTLAIVPVGMTKFRDELTFIDKVTPQMASNLINWVEKKQEECLKNKGSRFIWLSDEFYVKAGKIVPGYETYEEYSQLENGVGMIRLLWHEMDKLVLPENVASLKEIVFVTGESGEKAIKPFIAKLNKVKGLNITLKVLKNRYFGSSVTVTGLLTGKCLLEGLADLKPGSDVFIPDTMLKNHNEKFLDDYTISDIEKKLGINIYHVPINPKSIWEKVIKEGE